MAIGVLFAALSSLAIAFTASALLAIWASATLGATRRISASSKTAIGAVSSVFTMTSVSLATMGTIIIVSARLLQPDAEPPGDPSPPQLIFDPGGQLTQPLNVAISVDLRLDEPPHEACIQIILNGPGLTSSPGWHLQVANIDAHIETGMHQTPSSKGRYELWTEDPSKAHALICRPDPQGVFVTTSGSSSIVTLADFSVIVGDMPIDPAPDITVRTSLSNMPDWGIDFGPSPISPQSDYKNWYWKNVTGVNEVNSVSNTPTLRVHSLSEASQEHSSEFTSGVLYGLGAAAWVAAIQEGLNHWSRQRTRRRGRAA
ncbi:hypothetical protein [Streptomyces erythrochromogenes]|uniref:hypothetical protein n=1 Tax=Streptomyces erythrochromogenes TaxID=285574 RepID=UPI0037F679B4